VDERTWGRGIREGVCAFKGKGKRRNRVHMQKSGVIGRETMLSFKGKKRRRTLK